MSSDPDKWERLKSGNAIRGSETLFTDDFAKRLGYAFALWLARRLDTTPDLLKIAVGHDPRDSGPRLKAALICGLTAADCDVLDCGLSSTPAVFSTTLNAGADGAVMITASHQPPGVNGFKFHTRTGGPTEEDMRELVRQDLPFQKEEWTREEAIAYFENEGWLDKAQLLRYRPQQSIRMYRIGPLCEYFYGAMLPSTGMIRAFAVKPHYPGVVLMAPSPANPDEPAPYVSRAKFLREFATSQRWCRILGAENAADVNRMIRDGRLREFIRVNEALHDKSIAGIADEILRRGARVVMIFGPSSSGKTTFANRLAVHHHRWGAVPLPVSGVDFYRDLRDIPLEPDGKPDLEHVDALDVPLLTSCLEELLSGRTVEMPRFDFKTGARCPKSYELTVGPGEPLLLEGIHGMNDRITAEVPEQLTYGIYVSALSCINLDDHNRIRTTDVRLLRRIVRDMRFRNTSPVETIDMWPKVRAGEERWIFPNMEKADVMFNTSLHYELPVLKTIAYELLLSIPRTAPEYLVAHRLLKVLHYFLPVDGDVMDEIPPLSILREFIGECSFYDMH